MSFISNVPVVSNDNDRFLGKHYESTTVLLVQCVNANVSVTFHSNDYMM